MSPPCHRLCHVSTSSAPTWHPLHPCLPSQSSVPTTRHCTFTAGTDPLHPCLLSSPLVPMVSSYMSPPCHLVCHVSSSCAPTWHPLPPCLPYKSSVPTFYGPVPTCHCTFTAGTQWAATTKTQRRARRASALLPHADFSPVGAHGQPPNEV